MKIKTIFIGSGEFSILPFQKLMELDFIEVVAVVTQPDKPVGRKQELEPTPLKKYINSKSENLKPKFDLLQPAKMRLEAEEIIKKYQPELIIVASYGQILPDIVIDSPKYGCLNLHGSLLPQLRGATPVPMAILQGLEITGVTLQKMVQAMDAGGIISKYEVRISNEETTESLMLTLSELSAEHLEEDLKRYIDGEIKPVEQDESKVTFCYKDDIAKEKAEIKFDTDVNLADRMIRAFYPWPVAWLKLEDGKILKIYKAKKVQSEKYEVRSEEKNEKLKMKNEIQLERDGKSLVLVLKNGALELEEVQLEGKKRDIAKNYLFLAS